MREVRRCERGLRVRWRLGIVSIVRCGNVMGVGDNVKGNKKKFFFLVRKYLWVS